MRTRPKLSEKAKALHRIFSFLKLIQDSTALDRVKEEEIVYRCSADNVRMSSEKLGRNYDGSTVTAGTYKEFIDENNGRITINFLPTSETNGSILSHANEHIQPMFTNFLTENYYYTGAKPLEADILGTEALYGLPNSLIHLFSDCVRIVRHTAYYKTNNLSTPREFTTVSLNFEKKLLNWKPEWNYYADQDSKTFINETVEAVYHHTMSFYYGLIIYYFTMGRHLNNDFLQSYVKKVLEHLKLVTRLSETDDVKVLPLIWQGFVAGCASTSLEVQQEFKDWVSKFTQHGMGSYWKARQLMYEVWRRRDQNCEGDDWYSVCKDWGMNLMLF
ncbi:fungal specific transcription factor domain-containing protein NDAI_0F00120 [Naumovozyma dairenensis CBS 421]|uniref:Uncharacterized protein n=1 Tax=Naumovozyma dairenensis (strain ATCC 10597 / BCRC 20456 / CBS 421 / NBRC 0211 / NRRL Y-12639) TaxID=1071378 RepID=G0WC20_NAUDC|nr:hypothetical protein NDAI_0F00120 [Naumovozyma dairenensis CBS 421]CCD25331.1 hypothetical protein NDAI_0F00120 [Naumovozyma dairenensis CBS 421]